MNRRHSHGIVLVLAALALSACAGHAARSIAVAGDARTRLAILESTDLHSNILSYDYYKLAADDSLGFERMATLVRKVREEFDNTLLFDGGDTIQGTALADWQARGKPMACDQELAVYKAMDALGYDGGTIGNHEFNYGLPFLLQVTGQPAVSAGATTHRCKGPSFPLVLSNVIDLGTDKPLYPPTALLERNLKVRDTDGRISQVPIRIGIIGFTPPPIMLWDRLQLEGRVRTLGIVEAARRYAPTLRAQGADIIIAISHGGIDTRPYADSMENANWYLAQEPDIDVLLLGHSHQAFPDPDNAQSRFRDMPDVDNQKGFIHGKPAVMGNMWGKSLGLIDLGLIRERGRWRIDTAATHSEVRNIRNADGVSVDPDPRIRETIRSEHEATVEYVSTPIGESDFPMTSYFAAIGDVSSLQPVNTAQREYVRRYISQNRPDLKDAAVISAMAPFKLGFGGGTDFTAIAAGPLAIRNAADLYLYPNTVAAVQLSGAELKAWLEKSASYFNRIDPMLGTPQELVNRKVPSYNFDVIQGDIRYEIDLARAQDDRIVDLRFAGRPVTPGQTFILATNNYRASGGGAFPGTGGDRVVFYAPDSNRSVLIDWVGQRKHLHLDQDGADRSWRFAPLKTVAPVVFHTATGQLELARRLGFRNVRELHEDGNGLSTYAIDLSALP